MPPKVKVSQEQILSAAICIVREKGFESLNARAIAESIGCSVHPIFRTFESMEGLKLEVYKMAENIYNEKMLKAMKNSDNGFLSMGLTYIDFAKTEKKLFQLLFMSDAFHEQSIMDIVGSTEGDGEVIEMLCNMTGLSKESSKELYAGVWLTTHGIAAMFATNNCRFSDDENRRLLQNSFNGLLMKLKDEEDKINEKAF